MEKQSCSSDGDEAIGNYKCANYRDDSSINSRDRQSRAYERANGVKRISPSENCEHSNQKSSPVGKMQDRTLYERSIRSVVNRMRGRKRRRYRDRVGEDREGETMVSRGEKEREGCGMMKRGMRGERARRALSPEGRV